MAGQEGFEPPTRGFGDRCSANWSYWPSNVAPLNPSFNLLMRHMLSAEAAVFLEGQTVRHVLLVFERGVIAPLTLRTLECNQLLHSDSSK